ncbi:cupin [Mycobacterium persicum]|nr:cupin [Mycobacterium persicum]ORB47835.1 cupin [Mycobacterium persicum]ORB93112.1 cupin [Mycobacterium persicum]ORB98511.1 cupin [Mycobacterium persicum]ORC05199.1 cupin [Mycobacterium persicum]
MRISRNSDRPAGPGPQKYFTGDVIMKQLFGPVGSSNTLGGQMTFTACARTLWHTHPAGQTLIVTSGTGWVQEWGGAKQEIHAGDVVWTPPGVKHWHGATTSGEMTHIAIQDMVDGRFIDCMEQVSDEHYLG